MISPSFDATERPHHRYNLDGLALCAAFRAPGRQQQAEPLRDLTPDQAAEKLRAPGRVNVIGENTEYRAKTGLEPSIFVCSAKEDAGVIA